MIGKKNARKSEIEINYRDVGLLETFLTEQSKILPRRRTQLSVKQQKALKKSVKRARVIGLLPFVIKDK